MCGCRVCALFVYAPHCIVFNDFVPFLFLFFYSCLFLSFFGECVRFSSLTDFSNIFVYVGSPPLFAKKKCKCGLFDDFPFLFVFCLFDVMLEGVDRDKVCSMMDVTIPF